MIEDPEDSEDAEVAEPRGTQVDKVFKCTQRKCAERFLSQGELDKHARRVHELTYKCALCGRLCKNLHSLTRHEEACRRPKGKRFACAVEGCNLKD